jgi:uncharacterized BrkB/YihY/UPF0761 family membrane protein
MDQRPGERNRIEGGWRRRPPVTILERSLLPSCLLTAVVLIALLLLLRLRLPPLPYSLLVVGGLGVVCFIIVYLWQMQRLGRR